MVYAGVEIGVVADMGRHVEDAVRRLVQERGPLVRAVRKQGGGRVAQRRAGPRAECQEGIEGRPRAEMARRLRLVVEQPGIVQRTEVEDVVPDRDPAPGRARKRAEHAERQVLDWEVGVSVAARHPGAERRVVGVVERRGHGLLGLKRFARPAQHST